MSEIDDILKTFEETNSIKATAKENHCSWNRVVKILSSNGIVVNNTHEIILSLNEKGMSIDEISKQTGYNKKTIQAYLPASRPIYRVDISENAKRIQACRDRKKLKGVQ
jgi:transposase